MGRFPSILFAVLTLIGCTDPNGPIHFYRENWAPLYSNRELMVVHGGKDMQLVVRGMPDTAAGTADRTAYIEALRAGMYARNYGLPIDFTDMPSEAALKSPYRIVIQANATPSVSGRAICAAEGPVETTQSEVRDTEELLFVYCNGNRELSSLRLNLGSDPNVAGRGFARAVGAATARLLPKADPFNQAMGCEDC